MIRERMKIFRHGWQIGRQFEWLFWPIGFRPATAERFASIGALYENADADDSARKFAADSVIELRRQRYLSNFKLTSDKFFQVARDRHYVTKQYLALGVISAEEAADRMGRDWQPYKKLLDDARRQAAGPARATSR